MAGDHGVSAQADITGIPGAALSTVSFTQGLLRAVSADNVNPNAVMQVQAIGSCFQSNGPWAAKLPDLLSRASCVRLERLSTWIGWAKDDTPSFLSQTPAGRTAALLCCALGSLYSKSRCGMILFDISRDNLPLERQASSPSQLGDVCMVLESKLACLGFGNHLALQVTRLRQCFFEVGLEVPRDLVDTPTEEDMHAFLNRVRDALQDESMVLQFSGTKCSGTFLALVLAICPEDVSVQVNGEIIMRAHRDNIMFSISNTQHFTTEIRLETKLETHKTGFRKSHIIVEGQHELNQQINFSLDSILSSQLDIVFAMVGADQNEFLKLAVANLIASMAMSFTQKDFHYQEASDLFASQRFPAQGLKVVLGPMYRQTIQERLQKVLCRPSDMLQPPDSEYQTLQNIILTVLPLSHCTCGICIIGDPWNPLGHPKSNTNAREMWKLCPVSQLWRAIGQIAHVALLALFIQASPNSSVRFQFDNNHPLEFGTFLWKAFNTSSEFYEFLPQGVHNHILNFTRKWRKMLWEDEAPRICSSSSASTIYPSTLESPLISNPWAVQYELVEGRLHYRSDCYDFIISAMPERRAVKKMARQKARTSITQGTITAPSRLGEHSSLLMTLRPALLEDCQALLLRCQIKQANNTIDVDFQDIHLGLMSLTPSASCEHTLSAPLILSDYERPVKTTSVIAPVASGTKAIGITLTHQNEESQFLCCSQAVSQLYQGDCCMPCAVAQAEREGYSVVIGGSQSI